MRLLLDTHVMLWALGASANLSPRTRTAIVAADSLVYVSAASLWEIAIKAANGKVELPGPPSEWLLDAIAEVGFDVLHITGAHALAAGALPSHHRDPFDRMLVAQALADHLTVVTRDPWFERYGVVVMAG